MLLWSQSRPSGPLTDLQVPLGAHLWRLDLGPSSYAHSELSPQQQLSGEAASSAGLGPCHSAISSSPLPHLCLFTFSASPLSSFSFSCLFHYRFLLLPFFLRDQPHLPSSSATPFLSRPAAPIISSSATMSTVTFSSFSFSSCPFFSSSPPSPHPPPPPPQHAPDAGGDPGAGYQRQ